LTDAVQRLLPLGRVKGHRGRHGELTVMIFSGQAARWTSLHRVWVGKGTEMRVFAVEGARAYRDRLVLKLEGIDEATVAGGLKGNAVAASAEDAPALAPGEFDGALLVGMDVLDDRGSSIGRVTDVVPTGGVDLLVIDPGPVGATAGTGREEILVPCGEGIVEDVDYARGVIRIRPPEGLLELNRKS
jgi:16S rRNA processing protein RimM